MIGINIGVPAPREPYSFGDGTSLGMGTEILQVKVVYSFGQI